MPSKIAVIGSSNVDFIMRLERLPAVGETATDGAFLQTFGGKGANQAVAAARAGGNVTFVTGLGGDIYAPTILDNFRRDGIDVDAVLIEPGVASGSALVMCDAHGDNYLSVAPGANYAVRPEHIDACSDIIRGAAMLVMQFELPTATILRAMEIAAEVDTPVLFNYAPVRGREVPLSPQIQTLVINEHEAAALTGLSGASPAQAEVAAQRLRAQRHTL